jgi:hypothetical protein
MGGDQNKEPCPSRFFRGQDRAANRCICIFSIVLLSGLLKRAQLLQSGIFQTLFLPLRIDRR